MQKTVETAQTNSTKILESRALKDGEEVTVLDVRVEEIIELSGIHRIIDFEKKEGALELYLGYKRPDNTVHYLDDLRAVEKPHHSNVKMSLIVQDNILEAHELILTDKKSTQALDTPITNEIHHKTKVFDSEGRITGKPSLLAGTKK